VLTDFYPFEILVKARTFFHRLPLKARAFTVYWPRVNSVFVLQKRGRDEITSLASGQIHTHTHTHAPQTHTEIPPRIPHTPPCFEKIALTLDTKHGLGVLAFKILKSSFFY
jgi:hypothetical protein